jgi:hypothetical protein
VVVLPKAHDPGPSGWKWVVVLSAVVATATSAGMVHVGDNVTTPGPTPTHGIGKLVV